MCIGFSDDDSMLRVWVTAWPNSANKIVSGLSKDAAEI